MKKDVKLRTDKASIDVLTVIMITVCVFVIKSFTHEIIGHGGAVLLVGERITSVSTMWLNHTILPSVFAEKFVEAAGTLSNLFLALISMLMLRSNVLKKPSLIFFFWLTMTINIFYSGSYMIGWFIGPTLDWAMFISGMEPLWLWKIIMTTIGLSIILIGYYLSTKYWQYFIGNDKSYQ